MPRMPIMDCEDGHGIQCQSARHWVHPCICECHHGPSLWRRSLARLTGGRNTESSAPSYHDLHITTAAVTRTSIFNLPYGVEVRCTRVGGWQVWSPAILGGEYDGEDLWLVLDVAGYVIVDSRRGQ